MNIYRISQNVNHGYDTYDSAVIIAPDEDTAKQMNPSGGMMTPEDWGCAWSDWCSKPDQVNIELIGTTDATESRVVCASFNAG